MKKQLHRVGLSKYSKNDHLPNSFWEKLVFISTWFLTFQRDLPMGLNQ